MLEKNVDDAGLDIAGNLDELESFVQGKPDLNTQDKTRLSQDEQTDQNDFSAYKTSNQFSNTMNTPI